MTVLVALRIGDIFPGHVRMVITRECSQCGAQVAIYERGRIALAKSNPRIICLACARAKYRDP
jgi:formylmethanofuran dehydrogenase subunit E